MKGNHLVAAVLTAVLTTFFASMFLLPAQNGSGQTDSVVAVLADSRGLPLVPWPEIPEYATFWIVQSSVPCVTAPMPILPPTQDLPIYRIRPGQFLVDETGGELLSEENHSGPLSTAEAALILEQQAEEIGNHVDWLRSLELGANGEMGSTNEGDPPPPDEGAGDSTNVWNGDIEKGFTRTTNDLAFDIKSIINGEAALVISPP